MPAHPITASAPAFRPARRSAGATLGPWRLERLLGTGAWTDVFQAAPLDATSVETADYVLKLIKPEFAADPQVIAMLQREAYVSRCVTHPHLACVLSAHVDRPPFFLVMPFQAGSTLFELLSSARQFAVSRALWVTRQSAEGLVALHDHDWLHGDVKPQNIFVSHNGHVTLCDLGFARQISELRQHRDVLLGTPAYLAPELQCDSIPVTSASDVYALGIVLYELLTGAKPFPYTDPQELAAAHRLLPAPDPRTIVPQLPPSICRLLRRMLAKDPLRRPIGSELVDLLIDLEIDAFDAR